MLNNDDDIKYSKVINSLKQLRQVKAPDYFEANLMRKINSQNYKEKKPLSFWEKILIPSRIIPSASMAVAAVFLLFFVNTGSDDLINPLLADPRVREDMVAGTNGKSISDNTEQDQTKTESYTAEGNRGLFSSDTNKVNRNGSNPPVYSKSAAMFAGNKINKSGLNFRQINLTPEEKEQLNKLKEKIKEFWNSGN